MLSQYPKDVSTSDMRKNEVQIVTFPTNRPIALEMKPSPKTPLDDKDAARIPLGLQQGFDLRLELDKLEGAISDLKVLYEQYFLGILPLPPDKRLQDLKQLIRRLRKAPFKSAALAFRLRTLEQRYSALHTYWQRVLREKEEGTYCKDLFKADLREKIAKEEAHAATAQGAADKGVHALFSRYQEELEKVSGRKVALNFDAFKDSLKKRAKELKQKHGIKKLSFRVVVKNGRVSVTAHGKKES